MPASSARDSGAPVIGAAAVVFGAEPEPETAIRIATTAAVAPRSAPSRVSRRRRAAPAAALRSCSARFRCASSRRCLRVGSVSVVGMFEVLLRAVSVGPARA
jgi:hypothetical protein